MNTTDEHPNQALIIVDQQPEYWSLNKASKELGINKSTLSTDAAKGKIQWFDRPEGRRLFAPQLYTFYADRIARRKAAKQDEHGLNGRSSPGREPIENSDLNAALRAKEEVISLLKEQIEDIKKERDAWREKERETNAQLTRSQQLILALPAPANEQPVEQPKRRKFLGIF